MKNKIELNITLDRKKLEILDTLFLNKSKYIQKLIVDDLKNSSDIVIKKIIEEKYGS